MFDIDDPQRLLRPWKSLKEFTEELYAMTQRRSNPDADTSGAPAPSREPTPASRFRTEARDETLPSFTPKVKIPDQAPAPPPAPSPASRAPDKVKLPAQPEREPAPRVTPPPPVPAPIELGQAVRRVARSDEPSRQESTARSRPTSSPVARRRDGPTRKTDGAATTKADRPRKAAPTLVMPPPDTPDLTILPTGTGGTTVFAGKVVSHTSGSPARVDLYGDGIEADKTDTVDVKIPTLADGENIEPETWLFGIFQFQDSGGANIYYAQPPIWMA